MKSIRMLTDCAEKERTKAQGFLDQAQRDRSINRTNIDQARIDEIDRRIMEYDTKAVGHEKLAQGFEQQAKSLDLEAEKLLFKKNEIIKVSRLQIEGLEAQEKALRG